MQTLCTVTIQCEPVDVASKACADACAAIGLVPDSVEHDGFGDVVYSFYLEDGDDVKRWAFAECSGGGTICLLLQAFDGTKPDCLVIMSSARKIAADITRVRDFLDAARCGP